MLLCILFLHNMGENRRWWHFVILGCRIDCIQQRISPWGSSMLLLIFGHHLRASSMYLIQQQSAIVAGSIIDYRS